MIEQVPFYAQGKAMTYLPLLAGYTATFPAAVSDGGRVVGRASKPGAARGGRPPAQPGVRLGGRDRHPRPRRARGRRGLVRLWDHPRRAPDQRLLGGRQPHAGLHLGSGRDGLEGDCLAADRPDSDRARSSSATTAGTWRPPTAAFPASGRRTRPASGRGKSSETVASLLPRAVNNAGIVAGLRYIPDGFAHAVVWTREAGTQVLAEPAGYVALGGQCRQQCGSCGRHDRRAGRLESRAERVRLRGPAGYGCSTRRAPTSPTPPPSTTRDRWPGFWRRRTNLRCRKNQLRAGGRESSAGGWQTEQGRCRAEAVASGRFVASSVR